MLPTHYSLLPLILGAALASAATAATDWNAAAQQDMRFAIDTIRSSHAGSASSRVDVTVPLDAGGRTGMAEAATVNTEQDYRRAMTRFISGFGDPHTGIALGLKIQGWTGVVLDRVDGQYRVIWSEPDWPQPLPPVGATVQSCDDVWVGTYLKSNVAPFINHSLEYSTSASQAARQSMFDFGLGWTPKQCDFTLADGDSRRYALPLRGAAEGVGSERMVQVRKQYTARARPVGLYPLAAGMHWVTMPDFNGALSAQAYEKLYPQLSTIKKSGWVVFDLRGNGGGDSSWGSRALEALYGKAYSERLNGTASYAKFLIADRATIALYQRYANLPEYAASKDEFSAILSQLETAVRSGEKMAQVSEGTREQASALAAEVRQRPAGPRIAAIIDRGCFSSCMNFVQQIRSMADTVVLGETTLGYSPYGEINSFKLPSGNGAITIPSAIYTALQATREPFVPDLAYPGNIADEAALMKWVAAKLAALKPGQKRQ